MRTAGSIAAGSFNVTRALAIALAFAHILTACARYEPVPEHQVRNDFERIVATSLGTNASIRVVSTASSASDPDSAYEKVTFDIEAISPVSIAEGPLAGLSLQGGERRQAVELVLLYQSRNQKDWSLSSAWIENKRGGS
jgi:hypothetical protein